MSEITIKGGTGNGKSAGVDDDNRLEVVSKSESLQHWTSNTKGQAYQVRGETSLANDTVVAMHIKNDSTDKRMTITFIRHQVVGATSGTAFPNVSNYLSLGCQSTYTSGGTEVTPSNTHVGSNNLAEVTAYVGNPTTSGIVSELDRWYTKEDGDMNVYIKDGSLIIDPAQEIEIAYVGDHTGGIIEIRVSFLMEEIA